MSPYISKTGIKNAIPSFLKPTHAGSLIRMGHFKKEIGNLGSVLI